nr:hypothetical protein [Bradyrhizobium ivorense]
MDAIRQSGLRFVQDLADVRRLLCKPFVYSNPAEAALPCPSWKWNTAEYIFSRAKDLGVVSADKWLPGEATVDAKQSGERHSLGSLQAQARVLEKVSALHGRQIDISMLFAGEPALDAALSEAPAEGGRALQSPRS